MTPTQIEIRIEKIMEVAWELGLKVPIIELNPIEFHELLARGNTRFLDQGRLQAPLYEFETPYGRVRIEVSRSAPSPKIRPWDTDFNPFKDDMSDEEKARLKEFLDS